MSKRIFLASTDNGGIDTRKHLIINGPLSSGKILIVGNEKEIETNFGFIRKYDFANDLIGIYGKDSNGNNKISILNIDTEEIIETVSVGGFGDYGADAFIFCGSGENINFFRITRGQGSDSAYIIGYTFPNLVQFCYLSWYVSYYAAKWEAVVDEDNTYIYLNYKAGTGRKYDANFNLILEKSDLPSMYYGLGVNDDFILIHNACKFRCDKNFENVAGPWPGEGYKVPCAGGKSYFFCRDQDEDNKIVVFDNSFSYITHLDGCYCYNNFLGQTGPNGVLSIGLTQNYIVTIRDKQTLNVYNWNFNLVKQITSNVGVSW